MLSITKKIKKSKSFSKLKIWLAVGFFLIILTTLQCSEILNFNNVKPILLFPFSISFFMFNKLKNSATFAIVCGFFLDCFSERAFGFSSLFLLISCIAISHFCRRFIRIKFLNFMFLTSSFLLLFEFLTFTSLYIILKFENIWFLWISHILPTCAITLIFSPIFYLICKKANKIFNKNKNKTIISNN